MLVLVGAVHGEPDLALVFLAAFAAGCLLDLISATLRESATMGVASRVQLRVIAHVWMIDACIAPVGLLVAHAARETKAEVLLILPLFAVLMLLSRDRSARITQAQRRLDLAAHQRTRLQQAVRRLGDAFGAKLDLEALTDIVLRGSIEALDADAGRVAISGPVRSADTRDRERASASRRRCGQPPMRRPRASSHASCSATACGRSRCRSASQATPGRHTARSRSRARTAPSATTRRR